MLKPGVTEYPMEYPVTTELPFDSPEYTQALARFYDDWADRLADLALQQDVVVLCEGDPFFYGNFMHLHSRLQGRVSVEVIPGITAGMAGCWHATDTPITWGDDVLTVLMGTLPEEDLVRHMEGADALVVMKTGRNLPRVRRALERTGRLDASLAGGTRHDAQPAGGASCGCGCCRLPLFRDCAGAWPWSSTGDAGMSGWLVIAGLGPGAETMVTPEVSAALAEATDVVGYIPYVARVAAREGLTLHPSDNRVELDHSRAALEMAAA